MPQEGPSLHPLHHQHKHWSLAEIQENRDEKSIFFSKSHFFKSISLYIFNCGVHFTCKKSSKNQVILVICSTGTWTFISLYSQALLRRGGGGGQHLLWKFFGEKQETVIASLTFRWMCPLGPPCTLFVSGALFDKSPKESGINRCQSTLNPRSIS